MPRSVTQDVADALAADVVRPVFLVELDFSSGFVRLHSGVGDIQHEGNTYSGAGNLGSISEVREGASLQADGVQLALSGIPSTMVSTAMDEHYQGRDVRLWTGFLDDQHQLIGDPAGPLRFRMDCMDIELGEAATIVVNAENRLIDWDRPRIRRYTHDDQQTEHPTDKFFEYVSRVTDMELRWGFV